MQQARLIIATEDDIFAETREQLWDLQHRSHLELRDFLLTMGINLAGIEVSRRNKNALLQLAEGCIYNWRNESLRTLAQLRKEAPREDA